MDKETENKSDALAPTPASTEVKLKQRRLFWVLLGSILSLLLLLLIHWLTQETAPQGEAVSQTAPIYDVARTLEDKSYWMYKAEQLLKEQTKTFDALQKKLQTLESKWQDEVKAKENQALDAKQFKALSKRIEQLESQKLEPQTVVENKTEELPLNASQQWTTPAQPKFSNQGSPLKASELSPISPIKLGRFPSHTIFSERFNLSSKPEGLQSKLPHTSHYIPAGSFARAVLLNGVDVSVGVVSQQNPQPVLLRVTDRGNLPNHAVGDMKDCRLIGAATGEYSSERALIRVEKLSCVQKDNSVIETDVAGFVVGLDGKAGLRGPMITRDGELLSQGFISGLFSGLGKAVSSSMGTSTLTPFGSVNTVQGKELITKAGSEGVSSAFDILAKYAVQRLEQLQPIIQICAERSVDVVFHTGSQFGEKKERSKEKISKVSDSKFDDFEAIIKGGSQ